MLSPCIGICSLGKTGYCLGCLRTREEIAHWKDMRDAERLHYVHALLPGRGLARSLPERDALLRALYPLYAPPAGPGWNQAEPASLTAVLTEAAVLVGLVQRPQGTCVLFTRRTNRLRHHAGQVSFPGGRIEPADACAAAAALRESCEEIALGPEQAQVLGYLQPCFTISGFRVMPVVAAIDPTFVPVPQPAEVAEVFEVPLMYLLDPDNLHDVEYAYRGCARRVLEYKWPDQRIWGATAAILLDLRCRLEQAA